MKKSSSPFKQQNTDNGAVSNKIIALIIAGLAFILCASVFTILLKSDFDLRSALSGEVAQTVREDATEKVSLPSQDSYYLLYCYDEESQSVNFIWIVRLKLPQRTLRVFSPAVNKMHSYGNSQTSLNTAFRSGGVQELKTAVETVFNIKIKHYAGSTSSDFKSMVNYFGGVTFEVPEKVDYRDDFKLFLIDGTNIIKGDTLFKYLLWLGFYDNEESLQTRSDVLVTLLNTVFDGSYASRSDALFSKYANFVESDFTILDYRTEITLIQYLLENSVTKMKSVRTIDELTGK